MVRFGDGAPASVLAEKRHDVLVVQEICFEVEQEGPLSSEPKGGSGDEGAFDAVGLALAEDSARRHMSVPIFFEIDGEAVEKILDFLGRGKPAKDFFFALGQSEHGQGWV